MVKRCSAKNCYNSQLTHKIGYFGYPKNEAIAREWAMLAGRDDLCEKKIGNLTKYYLCSDHFSPHCFLDPDIDDKSFLKLNKIPTVPLPSIFEDNLMKNMQTVSAHPEKFKNYSKSTATDGVTKPEKAAARQITIIDNEIVDELKPKTDMCMEYLDEVLDINAFCRLCAKNSVDLIALFDDDGSYQEESECLKVMPPGVIQKDDGLPQYACTECLEQLQSCMNTIETFVGNQSFFVAD